MFAGRNLLIPISLLLSAREEKTEQPPHTSRDKLLTNQLPLPITTATQALHCWALPSPKYWLCKGWSQCPQSRVLWSVRTCRIDEERRHIYYSIMLDAGSGLNYLCSQCIDKDGLLLASLIYGSWHYTVLHFTQDFAVLTWKEECNFYCISRKTWP